MFHKEGYQIIMTSFVIAAAITLGVEFKLDNQFLLKICLQILALTQLVLVLQFFRNPKRETPINENHLIAPVDGKIVIIKEVYEKEYFKDLRIQVSIFMSPLNVHVTRYAISGKVKFSKYHPGKYLVAWHPKSSTENERSTIVIKKDAGQEVMFRQIAGAVARRIICYAKEGDQAVQGENCGFIKFGSRIDVILPLDAKILVDLNTKTVGSETVLAEF